jgi:hypothetical protein
MQRQPLSLIAASVAACGAGSGTAPQASTLGNTPLVPRR